jgi:hypothetical protein
LYSVALSAGNAYTHIIPLGVVDLTCRLHAGKFRPFHRTYRSLQDAELEFADRNNFEIQRMVDLTLEIAMNGLAWARRRESERLDQERDFLESGLADKNDDVSHRRIS